MKLFARFSKPFRQEESMQTASLPTPKTTTRATSAPIMLLPRLVERMITDRQAVHIAKFRTTCTDCVPNF
jgi:hypothetical protein